MSGTRTIGPVVSERAIVVVVKIEGPSKQAVDSAFEDLASRVRWSLPKRRMGGVNIVGRGEVLTRTVSQRGYVRGVRDDA